VSRILNVIVVIVLLTGCAERDKRGRLLTTPTSGTIKVAADESLRPLVDAEVAAFQGIYKDAHIEVIYTSEEQAIDTLLMDSTIMAIVTRRLIPEEQKVLDNLKIRGHQSKFATGGVALVVNRQNPDTVMLLDDLKKILSGEIKTWKDLTKTSSALGIEVVFDQPTSGIIRYLKDSLFSFSSLPPNCFALKSNQAVVEYVAQKPQALGVIDLSWISDRDDSTANSFVGSIKVMGLSVSPDSGYYQPYQAYIAQRKYPLRRDVVMISREYTTGLASGFMRFAAAEKGQRVVLKAGLVPATMPVRVVEINRKPFEEDK
jgi:ABC-type phosphate transport system substrate-binding protein